MGGFLLKKCQVCGILVGWTRVVPREGSSLVHKCGSPVRGFFVQEKEPSGIGCVN